MHRYTNYSLNYTPYYRKFASIEISNPCYVYGNKYAAWYNPLDWPGYVRNAWSGARLWWNNPEIGGVLKAGYLNGASGAFTNVIQNNLHNYMDQNLSGWDKFIYYIQALLSKFGINFGKDSTFNKVNTAVHEQSQATINDYKKNYANDVAKMYEHKFGKPWKEAVQDKNELSNIEQAINAVNSQWSAAADRQRESINSGGIMGWFTRDPIESRVRNTIANTSSSWMEDARKAKELDSYGNLSMSKGYKPYLEQFPEKKPETTPPNPQPTPAQ